MAEHLSPRGLNLVEAARYIGIGASTLAREARAGRCPRPVGPTPQRRVWLRDDLDAWLDALAGKTNPAAEPARISPADEWDVALGGTGGPAIP
jgi:predicted DNA-binding transcriptional regulator AlpA